MSFRDLDDGRAGIAGAATTWDVRATRNDGTALPATSRAASGVTVSDLVTVGGAGVDGAAGGMVFTARGSVTNRWMFFSESLGTFATGYALPTLDASGPAAAGLVTPQAFAAPRAGLAVFYDPLSLERADRGGNQLVVVSFDDDGAEPMAAETSWRVVATRNDGAVVADATSTFAGVTLRDLVSLAGAGVEGSAGRLVLEPQGGAARNRLVYFVESLGTFATGYLLPAPATDFAD